MANQVMRITLKAYDHQLVDASAAKIIETVKRTEQWLADRFHFQLRKRLLQS